MRSHFIVLTAPSFDLFLGVVQIHEPLLPEALQPHDGIEALGVGIVCWPSRLAEVDRDAIRVGP